MANANIVINIAVDVSYLYSQTPGKYVGAGVYMMDTNGANGSSGEGGLELNTHGAVGQSVAFNAFPITELQGTGASAVIQGFQQSSGTNVFGNQGWPKQQPDTSPYQYLGYLMTSGNMTYQIKIGVTPNSLIFPVRYYTWDPFFNVGTNALLAAHDKEPRLW